MTTSYGWAVLYPRDWDAPSAGAPVIGTVRETRALAMARWAEIWDTRGETPSRCWRRAYRKGWRLARVSITPALGYGK